MMNLKYAQRMKQEISNILLIVPQKNLYKTCLQCQHQLLRHKVQAVIEALMCQSLKKQVWYQEDLNMFSMTNMVVGVIQASCCINFWLD